MQSDEAVARDTRSRKDLDSMVADYRTVYVDGSDPIRKEKFIMQRENGAKSSNISIWMPPWTSGSGSCMPLVCSTAPAASLTQLSPYVFLRQLSLLIISNLRNG